MTTPRSSPGNRSASPISTPAGRDQLADTVDRLAEQIEVLRTAIDELRELVHWALTNRYLQCPFQDPYTMDEQRPVPPQQPDLFS